jgi:hypothetical protein
MFGGVGGREPRILRNPEYTINTGLLHKRPDRSSSAKQMFQSMTQSHRAWSSDVRSREELEVVAQAVKVDMHASHIRRTLVSLTHRAMLTYLSCICRHAAATRGVALHFKRSINTRYSRKYINMPMPFLRCHTASSLRNSSNPVFEVRLGGG